MHDRNLSKPTWIPHFTSIINWTLRLGLGLLTQASRVSYPWIAIIDHSIDIGTKKALVILRVSTAILSNTGRAIRLCDCECIGLKVSETVNGETIASDLKEIFDRTGKPSGIIKDCDYTLNKGVTLWSKNSKDTQVPVIDDISHVVAIALKRQFAESEAYKTFISMISIAAKRLRQTNMAFLTPPKLRSKGRFQSIGKLGIWADKILTIMKDKNSGAQETVLNKLHEVMPDFIESAPFITQFATTVAITSKIMQRLKNKGLTQESHAYSCSALNSLPNDSKAKTHLVDWFERHIRIKPTVTSFPLMVSSDIIESLFGSFKHVIERSPVADMNRTTLLIPALCGHLDGSKIMGAFNAIKHNDIKNWEEQNISYTVREKRQAFFAKPKMNELIAVN